MCIVHLRDRDADSVIDNDLTQCATSLRIISYLTCMTFMCVLVIYAI